MRRMVVRGYDQVVEAPDETYASTDSEDFADVGSCKLLACDVSTQLLRALMEGHAYVFPPVEYYPEEGTAWKLKCVVYGLKNSPEPWQQHLVSALDSQGYQRMKNDPILYFHPKRKIYLMCYVDALMLFCLALRKQLRTWLRPWRRNFVIAGVLSEGQAAFGKRQLLFRCS